MTLAARRISEVFLSFFGTQHLSFVFAEVCLDARIVQGIVQHLEDLCRCRGKHRPESRSEKTKDVFKWCAHVISRNQPEDKRLEFFHSLIRAVLRLNAVPNDAALLYDAASSKDRHGWPKH